MDPQLVEDVIAWRAELAMHRARLAGDDPATHAHHALQQIQRIVWRHVLQARGVRTDPFDIDPDGSLPADLQTRIDHALSTRDFAGADDDLPGRLHERLLAVDRGTRKSGGAFYTPTHVVRMIVADTVGVQLARTPDRLPRVLDPACGGGFFLLEAARTVCESRPDADRAQLVDNCIHGVDLDRLALDATRTSLVLAARTVDVAPRLVAANSLLGPDYSGPAADPEAPPLDPARAFPEAMADGGFDAVIANPPYLNLKRGFLTDDDKAYFAGTYRTAVGQYDAFALFLELALRLLRPGGRLGFLLPKPVLVSESYGGIRRLLFAETHIESVTDCGQPFPDAGVEAVTLIAEKTDGERTVDHHPVTMRRLENGASTPIVLGTAHQAALEPTPFAGLSYLVTDDDLAVLQRIVGSGTRLGDLCVTFERGIEAGKSSLTRERGQDGWPTLRGDDVRPFAVTHAGWFFDATEDNRAKWKSAALYEGDKVLVRRVADRPIAAVDRDGHWVLNTLYVLRPVDGVPAAWLAACLNSRWLAWVFRLWFLSDDRLFPYLRKSQLVQLPLPDPRELPGEEVAAVEQLVADAEAAVARGEEPTDAQAAIEDRLADRLRLTAADRQRIR